MTGGSDERGGSAAVAEVSGDGRSQRLDKWLWFARLVKTRSLASRLVAAGKVRINRVKCGKPSQKLHCKDVVTVSVGRRIRVLKVVAAGRRRGPAVEAQMLYEDLTPREDSAGASGAATGPAHAVSGMREPGMGRPTKRERRQLDRVRRNPLSGDA